MTYSAKLVGAPDAERDTGISSNSLASLEEWGIAMILRHPKAHVDIYQNADRLIKTLSYE